MVYVDGQVPGGLPGDVAEVGERVGRRRSSRVLSSAYNRR